MNRLPIWTVGHSNHPLEHVVALLQVNRIDLVVDVRSYPYSRIAPHYGREDFGETLAGLAIDYLYMGAALGGRPDKEEHYDEYGHALYGPMSREPEFCEAIDEVLRRAESSRLALLCSEAHPEFCHRRLLVGKVLTEQGAELRHILYDSSVINERTVVLPALSRQQPLFAEEEQLWRSTQSVLRKRPPSTFSID